MIFFKPSQQPKQLSLIDKTDNTIKKSYDEIEKLLNEIEKSRENFNFNVYNVLKKNIISLKSQINTCLLYLKSYEKNRVLNINFSVSAEDFKKEYSHSIDALDKFSKFLKEKNLYKKNNIITDFLKNLFDNSTGNLKTIKRIIDNDFDLLKETFGKLAKPQDLKKNNKNGPQESELKEFNITNNNQ